MARECARRGPLGRWEDASLRRDSKGAGEEACTPERRTDHPRSDWATDTPSRCRPTASGCWRERPERRRRGGANGCWCPPGRAHPDCSPAGRSRSWSTVPGCPTESGLCSPRSRKATRRASYVQDVETGSMRPITPEGVHMPEKAATPDGKSVLVLLDGKWFLYPIDGGQPRPLSLLGTGDNPRQWSADGRFLYVARGRLGSSGRDRATGRHHWPPRAVEDARPVRSGRHRASRSARHHPRRPRVLLLVCSPPPRTLCRRGTEIGPEALARRACNPTSRHHAQRSSFRNATMSA